MADGYGLILPAAGQGAVGLCKVSCRPARASIVKILTDPRTGDSLTEGTSRSQTGTSEKLVRHFKDINIEAERPDDGARQALLPLREKRSGPQGSRAHRRRRDHREYNRSYSRERAKGRICPRRRQAVAGDVA
jgi:hypothetical protein